MRDLRFFQDELIVALGYFDVPEFIDIRPKPGSTPPTSDSKLIFNELNL